MPTMKGIFLLTILALLCSGISAQEKEKKTNISSNKNSAFTQRFGRPHTLFAFRAGMSWMKFDNTFGIDGKRGYNATFGFMDPLRKLSGNFYWGMEFGFVSRGFEKERKDHTESAIAHGFLISPVQFGHLFRISDMLKVDVRLGVYASGDIKGEYRHQKDKYNLNGTNQKKQDENNSDNDLPDEWKWNYFDVGGNAGVGIVFGKFNLDFNYRYGIQEARKNSDWYTRSASVRIGVVF